MSKIINLVGRLLNSEETPCAYSYAIDDPNDIMIDILVHHSEINTHVLIVNNGGKFGHNFKVTLTDPKLQVSVIILLRQAIKDAYDANDPTRYIVIENIVKLVEEEAKKQEAATEQQ